VEAEDFEARSLFINGSYRGAKNPRIFLALATYRLVKEISQQPWQLIDRRLPSTPTMPIFYALATVWEFRDNAGAATAYRRTIELDRNYLNAYLGLGVVLLRQETTTRSLGIPASVRPRT